MPRLYYVSATSKRAVVATAIIGLILSVVFVLTIAERGRSRAAALASARMAQMGFFGYWSEDDGFKSTVVINNASNTQLTVNPVLYSLNGRPLAVDPIILGPRRQLTANVADWLAQGGAGEDFKQGNLVLNYEAPDAGDMGAQVTVTNPESSLSFDFRNEMPMSFESSRLEGMWWLPDGASRYDLVLSNMKSMETNVAVRTSGGQGSDGSSFDVALAPHQTQVINLDDKKPAFTTNAGAGKMGGISITHTGAPGGVLAYGLLSKRLTGFSSHFPFEDPATSRSQTLAAAHVLIGKPDTPGFSKDTRFTSIALIRNASDAALDLKPSISFVHDNGPRTLHLDARHLQPQQVDAIDLAAELKRARIVGAVSGTGLTLASTGSPGALMAHLTSYDQTRNHVFDVPMKDPSIKMNRFSGSYPFNLEGGRQSVVHVRNTTGEKARFTIQLDFEAGSYTLPIQILEPQQEAAIDIRRLRDSQTPDSIDRVIPKEVTGGQANWHEHGPQALIGRLEEFDVAEAMASSFSCPGPGCCLSTEIVVTAPGSMSKVLGETGHFKLLESRRLDCDGTLYGPFDVSADASWSSTNTSVVTVGAVSSSGVLCSFVGAGQANVHADFTGIISQIDPLSETCEGTFSPFPEDGPVEVELPELVGVFTSLVSGDDSATISGQAFAFQIQARKPGSNPPLVVTSFNNPVTVTFPSPSLISGESISANPVPMSQGVGQTTIVLKIVDSSGSAGCCRSYTLSATNATPGGGVVKIWFNVVATKEGLVGSETACGHTILANDHFVALPATGLCNAAVLLRNGSITGSTTVLDVGPWFPHSSATQGNPCVGSSDEYWRTTGIPRTETVTCDSNNAGIDLADGSFDDLGLANPTRILWRFN